MQKLSQNKITHLFTQLTSVFFLSFFENKAFIASLTVIAKLVDKVLFSIEYLKSVSC